MGKISKFSTTGSKIRKLVLFAAITYAIILIINQQITLAKINEEMNSYKELITTINNENEEHTSTIEKLHDLDYIEIIARKELGLIREHEKIYIFSK